MLARHPQGPGRRKIIADHGVFAYDNPSDNPALSHMNAHNSHSLAADHAAHHEPSQETNDLVREGESFVRNSFGDRYLYSVNRHAFDRFGAANTLDGAFRTLLHKEETLYIIAGTDSGLLYKHIRKMDPPRGSRYLFVELDEIRRILVDDGQLTDDSESIGCVPFENWIDAATAFQIDDYLYLDAVQVVFSLAAQDQHHPQYTTMAWQLREEVDKLRWQAVARLGGETFGICQLQNAPENIQPAHLLRGLFKGHTAALLAGGPSLDDLLPWVIRHREHLAVLAVSRIAARLKQAGITPDFIFSVDPTELSYDISKQMLDLDDRTTLIHQYHVAPRLLAQWPNRSLYLGNLLPWKSELNPNSPLSPPGPTVTNTALQVAHDLGFNTIILGGVDLCFTPEGYTHAQGSNERAAGPRFDLTSLEVETNAGTMAASTPDFATAIQTLSEQARHLVASGCTLFNPAPGAARIEHIRHVPIDALPISTAPVDVPSLLARALPVIGPDARLNHYRALERELSSTLHQLEKMQELICEALQVNESMFGERGLIEDPSQKLKLDRIEKRLDRTYRHLSSIVKGYGLREMLRAMRPFADYERLDADETRSIGRDYYKAYLSGARRLTELVDDALKAVRFRAREEAPLADLDHLAEEWRRQEQPGRVRVWKRRHPERASQSGSAEQALLDRLESQFREDLASTETGHMRRARAHADLSAARIRARQLFAQDKLGDLEALLSALRKHHADEKGTPYIFLVDGYVHELKGEMDVALERYSQVIQHGDMRLSEDALLRMTDWSLAHGQVEHALQALQCLAAISDSYTLQYAEMLRIAGDPLRAMEVYQEHIARFPEDVQAKLRLTRHLIDHQAYEGAIFMLEELLADQAEDERVKGLRRRLEEALQKQP